MKSRTLLSSAKRTYLLQLVCAKELARKNKASTAHKSHLLTKAIVRLSVHAANKKPKMRIKSKMKILIEQIRDFTVHRMV